MANVAGGPVPAIAVTPADRFGMRFDAAPVPNVAPSVLTVPLRPLAPAAGSFWPATRPRPGCGDAPRYPIGPVVVHGHVALEAGDDVASATLVLYRVLLGQIRQLGFPHLVRIWNFVPDINRGDSDDESYVRFNHGRAAAFDDFGLQPADYPAATAVGSPGGSPLVVAILASHARPIPVENPRQVSAYHYPRQYGPRAPSFARAMVLADETVDWLFISGTASIVGHASQHGDVSSQLAETLGNLDRLLEKVAGGRGGQHPGDEACWRVYLRNPESFPFVSGVVGRHLGGAVEFLQADICRRELFLEIEGIARLPGTTRKN